MIQETDHCYGNFIQIYTKDTKLLLEVALSSSFFMPKLFLKLNVDSSAFVKFEASLSPAGCEAYQIVYLFANGRPSVKLDNMTNQFVACGYHQLIFVSIMRTKLKVKDQLMLMNCLFLSVYSYIAAFHKTNER